jgi:hypothetical protein
MDLIENQPVAALDLGVFLEVVASIFLDQRKSRETVIKRPGQQCNHPIYMMLAPGKLAPTTTSSLFLHFLYSLFTR